MLYIVFVSNKDMNYENLCPKSIVPNKLLMLQPAGNSVHVCEFTKSLRDTHLLINCSRQRDKKSDTRLSCCEVERWIYNNWHTPSSRKAYHALEIWIFITGINMQYVLIIKRFERTLVFINVLIPRKFLILLKVALHYVLYSIINITS